MRAYFAFAPGQGIPIWPYQNGPVDLVIDVSGTGEKTVLVYRALRAAMVDGRLPAGHRLPPTRALAEDLGVARGSVATAYERLVAEGYLALAGRVGDVRGGGAGRCPSAPAHRRPAAPAAWRSSRRRPAATGPAPRYDFRTGIPDARLFPFDTWRRLVAAELRLRANSPGTYAVAARPPGAARGDRPLSRLLPARCGSPPTTC